MKNVFKVLYGIAIGLCLLILVCSLILSVDCILAYYKSCVLNTNCSCEVIQLHDKNFLPVISACFVGFVASLIQLILLLRNKRNHKVDIKKSTLDGINGIKAEISKFEFTLLKIKETNDSLNLTLSFNETTNQFVFSMSSYQYLQVLENSFQNSFYKYELMGDENVKQLLNNTNNTQRYQDYLNQLVFTNIQKRIDCVACKLNSILGDYYNGLLDDEIFEDNKDGIIDYYVSIIMYFLAVCYNQNDYNDYVYLVDYVVENFC